MTRGTVAFPLRIILTNTTPFTDKGFFVTITQVWSHRLTVRTPGFHPGNRSSILREITKESCSPIQWAFFFGWTCTASPNSAGDYSLSYSGNTFNPTGSLDALCEVGLFHYSNVMKNHQKQLRGVNLGGWLLLEKWMTPTLFKGTDAIDEYTFMQTVGAASKIATHRQDFMTEQDFAWMAANGINAIRIPIGYWALQSDSPFLEASSHLDWAMDMAQKYGLQVIIDLHGLKGSQNGRDHSGQVGTSGWFQSASYRSETITVLVGIAERYRNHPNLWGIQVINEPRLGVFHFKLRRFYKNAYTQMTAVMRPGTHFIYSDAFSPRLFSGAVRARPGFPVVMDVHLYHMTTLFSQWLSLEWFMAKTQRRAQMLRRLSRHQPIIIGEWSGVLRHELSRAIPADQVKSTFRDYTKLQIDVFNNTAGWFYWNYKTEARGQWNFRSQVEDGLITLSDL